MSRFLQDGSNRLFKCKDGICRCSAYSKVEKVVLSRFTNTPVHDCCCAITEIHLEALYGQSEAIYRHITELLGVVRENYGRPCDYWENRRKAKEILMILKTEGII